MIFSANVSITRLHLSMAAIFLTVALAGVVAAAPTKTPAKAASKIELTATFTFSKQSYAVGEIAKGTVVLQNKGKSAPFKIAYPSFSKKNVVAAKTLKLGKQSLPVSIKAEKPGTLTLTVTVTKPGDKKFKKVFTHVLTVEKTIPLASGSPANASLVADAPLRSGCPLSEEVVRRKCNLPATMTLRVAKKGQNGCVAEAEYDKDKDNPSQYSKFAELIDYSILKLYPEERPFDYPTPAEEFSGLGERAGIRYGKVDTTCGWPEAKFKLITLLKGNLVGLSSDGAIAAGVEWSASKSGAEDQCPTYISLGEGCNVEEVKALVKEVVLPYLTQ